MRFFSALFLSFFLLIIFAACETAGKKNVSHTKVIADSEFDNHSYSNIRKIRTKHLHLDLDVNFEKKKIYGVARHEIGGAARQ